MIADIRNIIICTSGQLGCAAFEEMCALTGRASAATRGTRSEVTHIHRGVEPSYHSVDSLIQPCRLNQICGSQLERT